MFLFTNSKIVNPEIFQSAQMRDRKTYFKQAKAMQMWERLPEKYETIDSLMKRSQFERSKDLTNLRNNKYSENFVKRPIL